VHALLGTRALRMRTNRCIVAWGTSLRSRYAVVVGRVEVLGDTWNSRHIASTLTGLPLAWSARTVDIRCTV
jgi:hypothetical protein